MRSLLCLWGRFYIFLSLSRSLSISNSLCLSIFISISVTWSAVARHRRLLMIFMEPSFAPWWSGTKLSLSAINPVKRRLHMDRRSKGSNQKVHVKHIHCPQSTIHPAVDISTDRQTNRHTHRQTYRHAHIETLSHIQRHTHREKHRNTDKHTNRRTYSVRFF